MSGQKHVSRIVQWHTVDADGNRWSGGSTREEAIQQHVNSFYFLTSMRLQAELNGVTERGEPIPWIAGVQREETVTMTERFTGDIEPVEDVAEYRKAYFEREHETRG